MQISFPSLSNNMPDANYNTEPILAEAIATTGASILWCIFTYVSFLHRLPSKVVNTPLRRMFGAFTRPVVHLLRTELLVLLVLWLLWIAGAAVVSVSLPRRYTRVYTCSCYSNIGNLPPYWLVSVL